MDWLISLAIKAGPFLITLVFIFLWVIIVSLVIRRNFFAALLSGIIGGAISYGVQFLMIRAFDMDQKLALIYSGLAFVVGSILGLFFPIVRKIG